jgi:hypothetical protein
LAPALADLLPTAQLQTNAFFDMSVDTALFGSGGSAYAQANRNRILSDAIPALTLPVGANHVSILAPVGLPDRNSDMNAASFKNGWPVDRMQNTTERDNWHHSDCREVAYTFTYKLFNQIVTLGELQ